MTDLKVKGRAHDSTHELSAVGEIDVASANQLFATAMVALRQPSIRRLVLDLAGVVFIDSSGLSVLIELRNASLSFGKDLELREPSARVQRLLAITGLDRSFLITASHSQFAR